MLSLIKTYPDQNATPNECSIISKLWSTYRYNPPIEVKNATEIVVKRCLSVSLNVIGPLSFIGILGASSRTTVTSQALRAMPTLTLGSLHSAETSTLS